MSTKNVDNLGLAIKDKTNCHFKLKNMPFEWKCIYLDINHQLTKKKKK